MFKTPVALQVSMARLNHCNVLCHFSHSGVDDMSEACTEESEGSMTIFYARYHV